MSVSQSVRNELSRILDNVIISAYKQKTPIASSKNEIVVGSLAVIRSGSVYDVVNKDTKAKVFTDLYLVEAGLLLAKYHQLKDVRNTNKVLKLENAYSHYYTDMMYFSNSYKHAKQHGDTDQMSIYEARYNSVKLHAADVKDTIRLMYDRINKK